MSNVHLREPFPKASAEELTLFSLSAICKKTTVKKRKHVKMQNNFDAGLVREAFTKKKA